MNTAFMLPYFVRPFVKCGVRVVLTFNFLTGNVRGLVYNRKVFCVIARFVHLISRKTVYGTDVFTLRC